MIVCINLKSYELYSKHIIYEAFSKEYIIRNSDKKFFIDVIIKDGIVFTSASFINIKSQMTETVDAHRSESLAITTSIGKCVINIGKQIENKNVPYGVLTGVRPINVAIKYATAYSLSDFSKIMFDKYWVSYEKSELLYHCCKYDAMLKNEFTDRDVSIYISIPFCPSRCNYCSFVALSIEKKRNLIPDYLVTLIEEIILFSEIVKKYSLNIKSVYIGGGTPGILSEIEIELLLSTIKEHLSSNIKEFSFEIGRPDTVNERKLEVLKNFNVNRISINTQTTNDKVLQSIGRKHTAEQYFNTMDLAKRYDFKVINTDIIAGLETENFDSFSKSVTDVINSGCNNLTIHTLCIKKSAELKEKMYDHSSHVDIDNFILFSKNFCIYQGFTPYYLYRQKYSLGNHESVGYCKDDLYCHYNISMMNEIETVIGLGAGATGRIISNNQTDKHVHLANFKYPMDYLRAKSKMYEQIKKIDKLLSEKFNQE